MHSDGYWESVLIGGTSLEEEGKRIAEKHNKVAAARRAKQERLMKMDQLQQCRLLQERGVDIGFDDLSDVTEVGLQLGILSLIRVGTEQMGVFDDVDRARERRRGRVIVTIGFGVDIFEVVDSRSLEVAQDNETE